MPRTLINGTLDKFRALFIFAAHFWKGNFFCQPELDVMNRVLTPQLRDAKLPDSLKIDDDYSSVVLF